MIIFEFDRKNDGVERIGAVGTCRVHTPLTNAAKALGGRVVATFFQGFTHSPAEANQQIEFCRGATELTDDLAPYILLKDQAPKFEPKYLELVNSCSTMIVEISSMQSMRIGRYFINQSYLQDRLIRGGGLAVVDWYRHVTAGKLTQSKIDLAVESLKAAGRVITPTIEEILQTACIENLKFDKFSSYIDNIVDDCNKRWIFVPIFNVSTAPPAVVANRIAIHTALRDATASKGLGYFDPSAIVETTGYKDALEGDGANPYHYAADFNVKVGEALVREVMNGRF